jgi:hypothetical protein
VLQLALFLVHLLDCLLLRVVSGGGLERELAGGLHGDEEENDTEIVSRRRETERRVKKRYARVWNWDSGGGGFGRDKIRGKRKSLKFEIFETES